MAFDPLQLWNKWGIQILVLLSLGLQITLLLTAGIRRVQPAPLPRLFPWLAYQLADSTAIYALGNLALGSVVREHRLAAFWAPFLLLHLGGPDNITAYALQDNELWPRHLLNFVIQILGAVYILYRYIVVVGESTILLAATGLMFGVGLAKYFERTWALKSSNFSSIRSSLKELPGNQLVGYKGHCMHHQNSKDEFLLQVAHSLFHICKRGIVDSTIGGNDKSDKETIEVIMDLRNNPQRMSRVMEMELSLMYDVLYTKAGVIHSSIANAGYCIRALSPMAIAASFLLFYFSGSKDGESGADVAITYVLLGGALVMETTSLVNMVGSSWALANLCVTRRSWLRHAFLCTGRWHRLRRVVLAVRKILYVMTCGFLGRSRTWSGSIGQFNLLYFRAAKFQANEWWFAKKLGFDEWWDNTCYSWNIKIPEIVMERAVKMVSRSDLNTMGLLRYKWGQMAFKKKKYYEQKYNGLLDRLENIRDDPSSENKEKTDSSSSSFHGIDFQESIITWHIATEIILSKSDDMDEGAKEGKSKKRHTTAQLKESIRALSNYLMFLLVTHPDMLPGLPQNWLYERTCKNLDDICRNHRQQLISVGGNSFLRVLMRLFRRRNYPSSFGLTTTKAFAEIVHEEINEKHTAGFVPSIPRLTYAGKIADTVLEWKNAEPVKVLIQLWTEFLLYAANRCNRRSHAKKLNTGGEFITIVWLMVEHVHQSKEKKTDEASDS